MRIELIDYLCVKLDLVYGKYDADSPHVNCVNRSTKLNDEQLNRTFENEYFFISKMQHPQ